MPTIGFMLVRSLKSNTSHIRYWHLLCKPFGKLRVIFLHRHVLKISFQSQFTCPFHVGRFKRGLSRDGTFSYLVENVAFVAGVACATIAVAVTAENVAFSPATARGKGFRSVIAGITSLAAARSHDRWEDSDGTCKQG
jgi:hypothetical protein